MTKDQRPQPEGVPQKLGISAFFPAYNDGGTIASMVLTARMTLRHLTDDYEIVVVNVANSPSWNRVAITTPRSSWSLPAPARFMAYPTICR